MERREQALCEVSQSSNEVLGFWESKIKLSTPPHPSRRSVWGHMARYTQRSSRVWGKGWSKCKEEEMNYRKINYRKMRLYLGLVSVK